MSEPATDRAPRGALLVAIFLSGLAGLVHEIVWARMLAALIGSTAHAQIVVLAVFMGGLALGAFLFGRRSDRRDRPLRTYARLEFLIAGYALILPFVLSAAGAGYEALASRFLDERGPLFALRLALSLLCLLLPAIWMGGTLPIVARFLVTRVDSTRGVVARLYALNNLGAVLGAGAAGFWLVPSFGILATLGVASAFNALAGILALRAEARETVVPARIVEPAAGGAGERYGGAQYAVALVALCASGFAAMGYEVLFTRVIALSFGSSAESFTVMLMSFIAGIGIGSAVVARMRVQRPLLVFGASQLLAAAALVAMTPLVSRLPYLIGLWRIELGVEGAAFTLYQAGKAGLILAFLLVPTLCIGFGFPLVSQIQARRSEHIGAAVGSAYAWNTIGNVLGVAVTGLVLLPTLGVAGSFHVHLGLNLAAGLLVLAVAREAPVLLRAAAAVAGGGALAAYALLGTGWVDPINRSADHLRMREGPELGTSALLRERHPSTSFSAWRARYVKRPEDFERYFFREDANATVVAYGDDDGVVLTVNTKPDASSFVDPRTSDITTQMLLAHLPMLFARETRAVLVIGHGSGITAGSAMLHASERGDVVEISRGVLDADALFARDNYGVLSNPRVHVWEDDGRSFMRTTPWRYDAIISEPSNPWIAGISGLFTREYFEEARARLAPGGVFCLWFHLYEQSDESIQLVLRTVASVFPHATVFQVLLDGDVIVLASNDPLVPDFARMEDRFDRPEVRRDLARMHAFNLATLFVFHAVPEPGFAGAAGEGPINTDGHTRLESMAARAFFAHQSAEVVWRHHCLVRSPRTAGDGLLDRYARWREEQKDPLSKEELEAALRRVQLSLTAEDAPQLIEALTVRIERARPRTAAPKRASRGAEPEISTVGHVEANGRGADRFGTGDVDGAIRYWRHAVGLDPARPAAAVNLAAGLQRKGDLAEAGRVLEAAIAISPRNALLRLVAGEILQQAGDGARALAHLEKAVELEPESADALAALGRLSFQRNDLARAVQCFERAVALDPAAWPNASALAQVLTRVPNGRVRALRVLDDALAIHPGVPELLQLRDTIARRGTR